MKSYKGKRYLWAGMMAIAAMTIASGCSKSHEATKDDTVRVKTMAVSESDISGSRVYSGTVEESTGTALSFPVAGTVQRVYVSAGDRVGKGQLIASLDNSTLQNAYNMSKATLDQARDAYNRMKQLHDANSLPDMQWVEVENTLKQAQSAEAIARRALSDAQLYSPVAGYVSEKFIDAGMTAAPGLPVVKVVAINPVKVNVSIPENEVSKFSEGASATITLSAVPGETFTGRLTEKGVTADPITRAYSMKFQVANPDSKLLPGMICDVVVDGGDDMSQSAIVLPTAAVLLDADNRNFVWLASAGHAKKRIVEIGGMTDNGIIITSGIALGDSVIVSGQQKVSENTPVISIDSSAAATAGNHNK